jgi:hypothetical protein
VEPARVLPPWQMRSGRSLNICNHIHKILKSHLYVLPLNSYCRFHGNNTRTCLVSLFRPSFFPESVADVAERRFPSPPPRPLRRHVELVEERRCSQPCATATGGKMSLTTVSDESHKYFSRSCLYWRRPWLWVAHDRYVIRAFLVRGWIGYGLSLVENGATGPVRLGLQSRFPNRDQLGGTKGPPFSPGSKRHRA